MRLICLASLVLVLAGDAVAQMDPASVTDGHVYLFENVGADVPDDSANSHTANLIGNPQVVDGLKGKALQFNGTSDGVHIPNANMVNLSTHQNRTVIAVFQCADVTRSEKQVVYEEGGTTRGLTIYVHEGLVYAGGWNLSNYTPEWTGTFLSAPISSGAWYAVAMVLRDGTAAQEDDKFEMWMNGELIGIGPGAELRRRSDNIGIGYTNSQTKFHDGNFTGGGSYFEGMVDEIWIINAALTQVELGGFAGEVWPYAFSPTPADGALYEDTWVSLSWRPGDFAVSHDVYFGENFDDVNAGSGGTFRGNQTSNHFSVGLPGDLYPDGVAAETTYYWRIDEVEADGVTKHRGTVWSFFIPSSKAYNPVPSDGATFVATNVILTWVAGLGAELHTVYFGDDPDTVANAVGGIPQTHNQYYSGALEFDRTYYWRVDEFDGAVTHKGDVWSFTAVPAGASEPPSAVSTFHCIGVYWSPHEGSGDNVCQVHYRRVGSTEWKEALSLWYDDRGVGGYPVGYRGSIVNLEPGTTYEIELRLLSTGTTETFTASTWSEDFPIAKTVYLPPWTTYHTLEITESGSPDGYVLYTHAEGESSTIDVRNQEDSCINVSASYVIIRGLTLREASVHGIRILNNAHDVVIEECDISGWGRLQEGEWGYDNDSAVYSNSPNIERVIVQRNKFHHPRADTNSWKESTRTIPRNTHHPLGPQAITFNPRNERAGHFVIRYNEIYSDDDHYFKDSMGNSHNYTYHGFPIRDTDIYGNYVANCWDDGIQAEGANCNVRIWGNYITRTAEKIATQSVSVGPLYIWRNVFGISRVGPNDNYGWRAFKSGDVQGWGGGKTYIFHNTILQPPPPDHGSSDGVNAHDAKLTNTCTRNNIFHVPSGGDSINSGTSSSTNDFDYDLYNGYIYARLGVERNGIYGVPIYDPDNDNGEFVLDPSSPGYDAGAVIPNFNDNYNGAAPDIGAHEAGNPPMEFGVNAYQ
jgi:hypothetical protein